MSKLEKTIWTAWFMCTTRPSPGIEPGRQCAVVDFAFLFGLTTGTTTPTDDDGVSVSAGRLGTWVGTQNKLKEGRFALVHTGTEQYGHYRAIVGCTSDEDGGNKKFVCCDSLNNPMKDCSITKLKSDEDSNGDGRVIILSL